MWLADLVCHLSSPTTIWYDHKEICRIESLYPQLLFHRELLFYEHIATYMPSDHPEETFDEFTIFYNAGPTQTY